MQVAVTRAFISQAARNNVLLAVPAGLYAINNYLKFTMQVHVLLIFHFVHPLVIKLRKCNFFEKISSWLELYSKKVFSSVGRLYHLVF